MRFIVGGVMAASMLVGAAPALAAPALQRAPVVSGEAVVGATLTTTDGTWFPAPARLDYKWWQCEQATGPSGTESCRQISGAMSRDLVARREDQGMELFAEVVACDAGGGCTSADSGNRMVFANVRPDPIRPPSLEAFRTPYLRPGERIRGFFGFYGGARITRTAMWQREEADGGWTTLSEAENGGTLLLEDADAGRRFRLAERAVNSEGEATQVSAPFGPIGYPLPASTAPPVISGVPQQDARLTASTGSWNTPAPLTYVWTWSVCRAGTCTEDNRGSGPTYSPTASNVGATIKVRVRASDPGGAGTAESAETGPVAVGTSPFTYAPPGFAASTRAPRATATALHRTRRGLRLRLTCDIDCTVDAAVTRQGRPLGRLRAPRATRSHVLDLHVPARTRDTLRRSKAKVTLTFALRSSRGIPRRVVRAYNVGR